MFVVQVFLVVFAPFVPLRGCFARGMGP